MQLTFARTASMVLPALGVVFLAAFSFADISRCPKFSAVISPSPVKPHSGVKHIPVKQGEDTWTIHKGREYKIFNSSEEVDWNKARELCKSVGADLPFGEDYSLLQKLRTDLLVEDMLEVKRKLLERYPEFGTIRGLIDNARPHRSKRTQETINTQKSSSFSHEQTMLATQSTNGSAAEKYRKIADSPYDLGLTWYGLHKEAGGKFKYTNGKLAVKYQFAKYEELEECVSAMLGAYDGEEIFMIPVPCDATNQLYICGRKPA